MQLNTGHHAPASRLLVQLALALLALAGGGRLACAQTPTPTPLWVQDGTNISNTNGGSVIVGTSSPGAALDVRGNVALNGAVPAAHAATNYSSLWLKNNVALMSEVASGYSIIKLGANYQRSNGTWSFVNPSLPAWVLDMGAGPNWDQFSISRSPAGPSFNQVTLFTVNPSGNVGIGTMSPASTLHLAGPGGVSAITLNTPGAQRFRLQSLPNVPNWGGMTLNSNYTSTGWVLDDPNTNGWFFKLDGRGGNTGGPSNGLWLYRIPPGANSHTDESPVFGVTSGQAFFAGNVGIGVDTPTQKLDVAGNVNASGNLNVAGTITGGNIVAKYQDVAEWVPSRQKLQAGTVVVLDGDRTNHVLASTGAYDTRVAGVVSASPGVILGEEADGKLKVATTGRVKIKVDATRAPIRVGDLLVTSDVEGVAMRSIPVELGGTQLHRPGTIIGKALEPLDKGTGEILVLLSLQ